MLMKLPRLLWILAALALFGALIGYFLSTERRSSMFVESGLKEAAVEVSKSADSASSEMSGKPMIEDLSYPSGAVEGELIVHFENRSDYLAYLEALADAGSLPLGQIDALLAVRISEDALFDANLGRYGARADFAFRIERPLPPVAIAPKALERLTAFGLSAREITGGLVGGSGEGIVVAILDSGIEAHPQFDDVSMETLDLAGIGMRGPGAGHGTSVASIVSGREGIVPEARLLVVRVLDEAGMGNSYHVAQGIVEAVDLGAQVINMSLGVYQDTSLLRQAVSYAHEQGVLMVAPSGNDGYKRMMYPAAYPQVLSVTAVDASGQQALFPNQSEAIDFAAPGVGVLTAKEDEGTILFSGTSAAAPFVTGTLASLMSGDGALPAKQAVDVLKRYLNDQGALDADPVYGAGVVDWDRLSERGTAGLVDVALADIYLQADALPGTTMPVEVIVQNRGTTWLRGSQLEVFVDGADPLSFTLGSLGPGQTTSRKIFTQVPASGSGKALSLAARVTPEKITDDIRLENNAKAVSFSPVE